MPASFPLHRLHQVSTRVELHLCLLEDVVRLVLHLVLDRHCLKGVFKQHPIDVLVFALHLFLLGAFRISDPLPHLVVLFLYFPADEDGSQEESGYDGDMAILL